MGVSKSLQKYALDTDLILKADLESATGYVRPSQLPPLTPAQDNGTYIVNGGKVAYLNTAYDFRVTPCNYVVGGARYYTAQTDVSLATAHASFNRFDIIAVNTGRQVVVIQGTAAANPSTPDFDALSGLALSTILVIANSTTPYGNTTIYTENAEWTSSVTSNVNAASTSNPFAGTKDIEFTNAADTNYVRLTNATTLSLAAMKQLTFMLRNKAAWPSQKSVRITWYNGSTKVGQTVQVSNGRYNFNHSNISTYQLIVVPIADFAVPNTVTVDRIEFLVAGNGGTIGFYIDNILLEPNSTSVDTVTTLSASQITGPYTSAGMTMTGQRILGRTSGVGPAEEIIIDPFFSFVSGVIGFGGTLGGVIRSSGSNIVYANPIGTGIDINRALNTSTINTETTFNFSGGTPATGQYFSLLLTNSDTQTHLITIPTGYSLSAGANINQIVIPGAGKLHLTWRYDGTGYTVYGDSAVNMLASTGKQTIYMPAAAMIPSVTSGCSSLSTVEIGVGKPNVYTLDFDGNSGQSAEFCIAMPKSWNEGGLNYEVFVSHAGTGLGTGMTFGLQAVAVSSDETLNVDFGTPQFVVVSGGAVNKLYRSSGSSTLTVAGSPATGDSLFFRIFRDPNDAGDNYTGKARLHGIKLYYTIDQANDL